VTSGSPGPDRRGRWHRSAIPVAPVCGAACGHRGRLALCDQVAAEDNRGAESRKATIRWHAQAGTASSPTSAATTHRCPPRSGLRWQTPGRRYAPGPAAAATTARQAADSRPTDPVRVHTTTGTKATPRTSTADPCPGLVGRDCRPPALAGQDAGVGRPRLPALRGRASLVRRRLRVAARSPERRVLV